jgi:hypothetical protein
MNRYIKQFLHRGLIFGGFGPLVMAVIYLILSYTIEDLRLTGVEAFTAILSTYLLAFVHAGASVFNQIEHWPIAKSLFFHFFSLYLAYMLCYLVNTWIRFEWIALLVFTAIFAAGYFAVWITVVISINATRKKLNQRLHKQ